MYYAGWKLAIAAVVGLFALVGAISTALERSATRRKMLSAQREIADNTAVTLIGTVKLLGEPMIAPLSGKPCVFHCSIARILAERQGDERPIVVAQAMIPFVLVTREGDVIVEGSNADVPLRPGAIVPRKADREVEFLRANGHVVPARRIGSEEVLITPGMKIAVHGVARIEMTPGEAQFRETARQVKLVAHPNHPITLDVA